MSHKGTKVGVNECIWWPPESSSCTLVHTLLNAPYTTTDSYRLVAVVSSNGHLRRPSTQNSSNVNRRTTAGSARTLEISAVCRDADAGCRRGRLVGLASCDADTTRHAVGPCIIAQHSQRDGRAGRITAVRATSSLSLSLSLSLFLSFYCMTTAFDDKRKSPHSQHIMWDTRIKNTLRGIITIIIIIIITIKFISGSSAHITVYT